jgi:hypothetical protein
VRRWLPWAIVFAAALAYPLAVLAGGAPAFPSRDDCVRPAVDGAPIEAVLAYVDSEHEAKAVRERALGVGFKGIEIERNACGRVKVAVRGVPTLDVGREFAKEAAAVGFDVTLERQP